MLRPLWRRVLGEPIPCPPHGRASFRSTPVVCAKWKSKFNRKICRPPKDEAASWHSEEERSGFRGEDISDDLDDRAQAKNHSQFRPRHPPRRCRRNGKKSSRSFYSEDDDGDLHVGPVFQATFGNRCYTWSFRPWQEFNSRNPPPGFEWRGGSGSTGKDRVWESSSESDDDSGWANHGRAWERDSDFDDDDDDDDDDDPCRASKPVGLYSHRATLGLPATGPLKIGDVKIISHAALKWHPDRHPGLLRCGQSVAEEKFKRCLDAYKCLCDALNSA
ncbi:unnamed protein product [Spirodela intermedia]|uniref:J domain-containing protein n=1 Tax=Spirodela intermedia TaxID=51605 RepID=A0A7I8IRE4_SPIIN|nr:unnamed protein product [Spirodela intermedia]CAA6660533.1 unnamed protein product [Spirodela intermedia]